MLRVKLMIGDREPEAADGRTFERVDPATGSVATRAAAATIVDAVAAADAAARALPGWSAVGPGERRARLNAAADTIEARGEDFAEAMIAEIGAAPAWCEFNVRLAAAMLRQAASLASEIVGEAIPPAGKGRLVMTVRQPAGVVLAIAPWSAPLLLGVRALAVPLACGNTVVLKASERAPATHRLIGTALRDAGFPDGVVNVVTHAPEDAGKVLEALIGHPAVRRVSFAGATRAGREVAETAARYLKPALIELGGRGTLVVLDDADLEAAAAAASFGAFINQGQFATSTERVVVDAAVADAFVAKFAARAEALAAGDPRDGEVALGPLVGPEAVARTRALVDDALAKGARLIAGGKVAGSVMAATVLDQVTPAMRIWHERVFAPVAAVVRAGDADEAVRIANDGEAGFVAAVFGRDTGRALTVAKRIACGVCHINAATVHDEPQLAFGGGRLAGCGRLDGRAAIDAFTELHTITIATEPQSYPL